MSTSNGYSAAYDAVGNMIYRAPTSSTTCNGTQTGQQLSYDPQGRFTSWQNQPNSPTQTANYLYDGSGNRVAMQTVVNGTTTLTAYINDIEEIQKTGSTTQTTTYYYAGGQRIAANVNGTFYYFGNDALGSQVLVLSGNGGIVGSQLYGPYGNQRYSSGALPTSIGFTGQHTDSVTGLDYYNARYYDPAVGQFLSPDWIQGNILGLDPYTYVSGNPETLTDPSGLCGWQSLGDVGDCFTKARQTAEQVFENPGEIIPGIEKAAEEGGSTLLEGFLGVLDDALDFLAGPLGLLATIVAWLASPTPLAPAQVAPSHNGGGGQGSSGGGGHGGGGGGGNPPPPNKGDQQHARKTLDRLESERLGTSPRPSARSEGVLSDGRILTQNSFSYKPGNPATPSPDFGRVDPVRNNGMRAYCAEARCMQEAQDIYGNNPPYGFNEFWETQANGSEPCDLRANGGCTPGFGNFSNQFGPTRVWWQNAQGVLHSQDFVNGSAGPVITHP